MKRTFLRAAVLASALAATLGTRVRDARADEKGSIVVVCEGADSDALESRVTAKMSASRSVQPGASFRQSLAAAGGPSLANASKNGANDAKLVSHARASVQSAGVDAAVLVQARRSKRATLLHIWLVDAKGDHGAAVDKQVSLPAHASIDDEADAVWSTVARALPTPAPSSVASGAPASTPASAIAAAPSTSATESTQATEEPEAQSSSGLSTSPANDERDAAQSETSARTSLHPHARTLASIRASIQGGSRSFTYVDRISPSLRPYNVLVTPLVAIDADVYPFARTRTPILENFGITGDYAVAFALASEDSAGTRVSGAWSAFDVGARERIPIGKSVLAGIHGGYGAIHYAFGDALGASAQLPNVDYRFLRGGADVSVALGAYTLYASGSYLSILSTGPFGALFPRANVGGIEAGIGATRSLGAGFEASLAIAYTRFYSSLHPEPGDAYVAGGALDQMGRASLGIGRVF